MTDNTTSEIDQLLRFDSLATAEQITGKSYKEDEDTVHLGLGLSIDANDRKAQLLKATNDTNFRMNYDECLVIYKDLGFEIVLDDTFQGRYSEEHFVILWHPRGILAKVESYGWAGERPSVNTTNIYYNFKPKGELGWRLVSSGSMCAGVWIGDHDAREGVRHNINAFLAEGEFLTKWIERPWLWLIGYSEGKDDSTKSFAENSARRKSITEERISRLPEHVRTAITPAEK